MNHGTEKVDESGASGQRVELRYCERCGVLRLLAAGASNTSCPACWRVLRWMYGEVRDAARQF